MLSHLVNPPLPAAKEWLKICQGQNQADPIQGSLLEDEINSLKGLEKHGFASLCHDRLKDCSKQTAIVATEVLALTSSFHTPSTGWMGLGVLTPVPGPLLHGRNGISCCDNLEQ